MTTVTKLKEARALIERGWCQGFSELNGSHCILGALGQISPSTEREQEALKAQLRSQYDFGLAYWNDEPGRTQAEVLNLFDRAIAAEEAKEKA